MPETELFAGRCVLTNCNVWSPDSEWIAFDTRSDPAGSTFDGTQIRMVNAATREVRTVYESQNGACCGAVTFHPVEPMVAFIHGPEFPTPEFGYGPSKRHGVTCLVIPPRNAVGFGSHPSCRWRPTTLDARNLAPPFTAGALRGGSHVHTWNPGGDRVSFTYEDDITAPGLRTVGVTVPAMYTTSEHMLTVPKTHPRNHDGGFSVLVVNVVPNPKPGSDEIRRAVEEGWVGKRGYRKPNKKRQQYALAFQGFVLPERGGEPIPEVFIADLPQDLTRHGDGPLQGTLAELPAPPRGVTQRRLTFTANDPYPGVFGPRHWLRSSPDGSRIAFLKRDRRGVVQLFTVSPNGGESEQVTDNEHPVASPLTWHPDGRRIAFAMDHSVCLADATTGVVTRLTTRTDDSPRPEACVMSPDGRRVAFVRHRAGANRICVVEVAG